MPSQYQQHVQRWHDCQLCDLCEHRKHVVLFRGRIPNKVLFIGEAPGESEDVVNQPFVGPAGKLLDKILLQASETPPEHFAYTNLICCIPRDEDQEKVSTPPKYAVEACANRLREIVHIVQPKLVVWVGDEAKKYGPKILAKHSPAFNTVHILHPGHIIRLLPAQTGMAVKRTVVTLRDALEAL